MIKKGVHTCKFEKEVEILVPVRSAVKEHGKVIRDVMTAKDTIKQRKCKCGKTKAYDMERVKV